MKRKSPGIPVFTYCGVFRLIFTLHTWIIKLQYRVYWQ